MTCGQFVADSGLPGCRGGSWQPLRLVRRSPVVWTTGQFRSNREPRWRLQPADPQFGAEADSKIIELRLAPGMMLEFVNAPTVDEATSGVLARYIGHPPVAGTNRQRPHVGAARLQPLRRRSARPRVVRLLHIGHDNPTIHPRHVPTNVSWRSLRSNLIQGDMTLVEARTRLIQLVAC